MRRPYAFVSDKILVLLSLYIRFHLYIQNLERRPECYLGRARLSSEEDPLEEATFCPFVFYEVLPLYHHQNLPEQSLDFLLYLPPLLHRVFLTIAIPLWFSMIFIVLELEIAWSKQW